MPARGGAGGSESSPLAGPWVPSDSPLLITLPAAADVRWTSAGRRMSLALSATGGLEHAASAGRALIEASDVTVGTQILGAGPLAVTPLDVRRAPADGIEERWLTALELPVFLWELESEAGGTVGIGARLADGWLSTGSDDAPVWDPAVRFADAAGRLMLVMCEGPRSAFRGTPSAASVHVSATAIGRLRLAVVLAEHAADLDRTLQLVAQRGFAGLRAQRAQHARLLHDYGTALSTPLPALDEAFAWASLRADELPGAGPGAVLPLAAMVRAPRDLALSDPAGFISSVLAELWGAEPDAGRTALRLAPRLPDGWRRMALSRFRLGGTTLDWALSRRAGQVTIQLRRRSGPAASVSVALPGLATGGVSMDGVQLGGSAARFEAVGEHEIVFDLAD